MKQLVWPFTLFLLAVAPVNATSFVVYSNFGIGDSVKGDSIHHILNEFGYIEHAGRFQVPAGTPLLFTGADVAIVEATDFSESHVYVRLRSDDAGRPGAILESVTTEVLGRGAYLVEHVQHVNSASNPVLNPNEFYWLSLAAINPGSAGWWTNGVTSGGYAVYSPEYGMDWLVIDTAEAGAFRVFGTAIPEPSSRLPFCVGLVTLLLANRQCRGKIGWRRRKIV